MEPKNRKKRNNLPISNEIICDALRKANGYITIAAKMLNKSKSWMSLRCKNDPAIHEFLEGLTEERLDQYEDALDKLRDDGNSTAIIFYLKTKGRHRGYIEHAPRGETDLSLMRQMTEMFSAISKPQSLPSVTKDSEQEDLDLLPEKTVPVEKVIPAFQSDF